MTLFVFSYVNKVINPSMAAVADHVLDHVTDHVTDDARQLHNQLWGIPRWSTHVPVATPVSLGREDLSTVLTGGYVVASKTDGERCVLVVGALAHALGTTYAVRFDRAGTATVLGLRTVSRVALEAVAPAADPCEGTLLDCEWVAETRELVLLDALVVCGYDLKPVADLHRRLALGLAVGRGLQLVDASGPVHIVGKAFVALDKVTSVDPATHADGLVFMPAYAPAPRGRATDMFKWKPVHTVDAMFHQGRLVFLRDAAWVPIGDLGLRVDDTAMCHEGSVYELAPADGGDVTDDATEPGEVTEAPFRVVCMRADKAGNPNQVDTVVSSLRHMAEGVGLAELHTLIKAG